MILLLPAAAAAGGTPRRNCNAQLDAIYLHAEPASFGKESVIDSIGKLYPSLSQSQLATKIKGVENEFMFFRGFAPVFYRRLAANPEWLARVQTLLDHSGWMVGDAHPENFGFLTLDGKVKFTVNDLDDAGQGPVALDLVRFVSSIKILHPGIGLKPIIEAYVRALTHERKLDDVIDDLREKSEKKGRKMPKNLVNGSDEIDRANPEVSEVEPATSTKIRAHLASLFPGASVRDVVAIRRTTGGSAFRPRYLAQIKYDGELLLIELKALDEPAIIEFTGKGPRSNHKTRLEEALNLQQGDKRAEFYRTTLMGGTPYLVRPRFGGNQGIKLSDFEAAQHTDLFAAEAEALARFHRKTIEKLEDYAAALAAVPITHWDEIARALAADSNHWFRATR